jgi:hypothetical protein
VSVFPQPPLLGFTIILIAASFSSLLKNPEIEALQRLGSVVLVIWSIVCGPAGSLNDGLAMP